MERVISVEEKIRRAEEIYNRRRENESARISTKVNADNYNRKSTKDVNRKLKKMITQIIICMLIYFMFYYIINGDYVFSEDFRNKAQEILSYDISLNKMYEKMKGTLKTIEEKYQGVIDKEEKKNLEEIGVENKEGQSNSKENSEENNESNSQVNNMPNYNNLQQEQNNANLDDDNNQEDLQSESTSNENIGGAVENEENQVEISNMEGESEIQNLSEEKQMKIDAEYIKSKVSFIKPLKGTITSNFGPRNPTVSTVSKYHTGIDIAANQGTDIISATNGKVILASSEGAYGNHLKIQIEDIIIIYAHCLSLNVKENDQVVQGQTIAKVGSTGNSTGPHLHFEIRKGEEYIDPKLILDF